MSINAVWTLFVRFILRLKRVFNESNLNMNRIYTEQFSHSLPKKTQPTLNSSTRIHKTSLNKFVYKNEESCPEVSEFKTDRHTEKLYVHRLNIDYGRLQRPYHE